MRHSLSTGKEFVRIKETRHKFNRGSEWCLTDSNLGRWYLQITEDDNTIATNNDQKQSKSEAQFSRLLQLSTLIPELSASVLPKSPERPVLLNLSTCPDYLLGNVPHPELFVINNRRISTTPDHPFLSSTPMNMNLPLLAADSYLGSPLSRKTTPKPFDMEMDLEDDYLNFTE